MHAGDRSNERKSLSCAPSQTPSTQDDYHHIINPVVVDCISRRATRHSGQRVQSYLSATGRRKGSRRPCIHRQRATHEPRLNALLAVSVKEKSLNSHEFECRPRHKSLLPVLRRDGAGICGLAGFAACPMEPWLAEDVWRGCFGCCGACVGLVGWVCVVGVRGVECSGEAARERARSFALMALKKESSGVVGEREYSDVGECMAGDAGPEECEEWEEPVAVRMGGGGWKLAWEEGIVGGADGASGVGGVTDVFVQLCGRLSSWNWGAGRVEMATPQLESNRLQDRCADPPHKVPPPAYMYHCFPPAQTSQDTTAQSHASRMSSHMPADKAYGEHAAPPTNHLPQDASRPHTQRAGLVVPSTVHRLPARQSAALALHRQRICAEQRT